MNYELRVKNAFIGQFQDGKFSPVFGNLIIKNGQIKEIQKKSFQKYLSESHSKKKEIPLKSSNMNEYDANGRIILPPFANFHEHIYSRLAKGLPVSGKMDNFLNILKNLWWKLDKSLFPEAIKISAEITAIEAIKNGVGTIFDHHSSPNCISGSLNIIKNVLKKRGLRAVLSYEVSDRNGLENMKESVQENLKFFKNEQEENFKAQFGLHALFTLSDATLKHIKEETKGLEIGFHIHSAEDLYDVKFNQEKYGLSLLERMAKFHLLKDKTFLAHGNHLPKSDYPLLKKYDVALIHNPDSNFNNAVGTLNISNLSKNMNLVLGTDGMHSDILKTMKMAFLTVRHQNQNSEIGFEIIENILQNNFKIQKRFFKNVSQLNIGDKANFIVLDYMPYTLLNSDNFISHFIYGICESDVKTMYQNGKFLMKDFVIDEEARIYKKAVKIADKVRKNFIKYKTAN